MNRSNGETIDNCYYDKNKKIKRYEVSSITYRAVSPDAIEDIIFLRVIKFILLFEFKIFTCNIKNKKINKNY